jgi:zinc transport system permease protein
MLNFFSNVNLISFSTILLTSLCCSLIGSFVLWKKLSFYGDAMSHSTLFGVAIGVFLQTNQIIMLILFNLIFTILINLFSRQKSFAIDSIVMIFSYFFIACAVLFNENFNENFEFEEFLFGDISKINFYDLILISCLTTIVIKFIKSYRDKFLISIINPDIAQVKKIKTQLIDFYFMIILSLIIAFAIQVTGIFLITALMIIPCAIARIFAKTPSQMIKLSTIFSIIISFFAILLANSLNISIAPAIILTNCLIFFLILFFNKQIHAQI